MLKNQTIIFVEKVEKQKLVFKDYVTKWILYHFFVENSNLWTKSSLTRNN
jgi:hypothetical protein